MEQSPAKFGIVRVQNRSPVPISDIRLDLTSRVATFPSPSNGAAAPGPQVTGFAPLDEDEMFFQMNKEFRFLGNQIPPCSIVTFILETTDSGFYKIPVGMGSPHMVWILNFTDPVGTWAIDSDGLKMLRSERIDTYAEGIAQHKADRTVVVGSLDETPKAREVASDCGTAY
jgi:hypothetical protein